MSKRLYTSAIRLTLAGLIAPASLAATPPVPPAPLGPQRLLFEWQGRVDKEIRVEMRGNRTSVDRIGNKETSDGRVRNVGSLPQFDAPITVQTVQGRGRVDVLQQPTRQNNYTAIIRVRDPQSGADNYRLRVYTTANQYDRDNNGNGKNKGRGHDRGRHRGWDHNSHDNDDRDSNHW